MSYIVYREENRIQQSYSYRERKEEDRKKIISRQKIIVKEKVVGAYCIRPQETKGKQH